MGRGRHRNRQWRYGTRAGGGHNQLPALPSTPVKGHLVENTPPATSPCTKRVKNLREEYSGTWAPPSSPIEHPRRDAGSMSSITSSATNPFTKASLVPSNANATPSTPTRMNFVNGESRALTSPRQLRDRSLSACSPIFHHPISTLRHQTGETSSAEHITAGPFEDLQPHRSQVKEDYPRIVNRLGFESSSRKLSPSSQEQAFDDIANGVFDHWKDASRKRRANDSGSRRGSGSRRNKRRRFLSPNAIKRKRRVTFRSPISTSYGAPVSAYDVRTDRDSKEAEQLETRDDHGYSADDEGHDPMQSLPEPGDVSSGANVYSRVRTPTAQQVWLPQLFMRAKEINVCARHVSSRLTLAVEPEVCHAIPVLENVYYENRRPQRETLTDMAAAALAPFLDSPASKDGSRLMGPPADMEGQQASNEESQSGGQRQPQRSQGQTTSSSSGFGVFGATSSSGKQTAAGDGDSDSNSNEEKRPNRGLRQPRISAFVEHIESSESEEGIEEHVTESESRDRRTQVPVPPGGRPHISKSLPNLKELEGRCPSRTSIGSHKSAKIEISAKEDPGEGSSRPRKGCKKDNEDDIFPFESDTQYEFLEQDLSQSRNGKQRAVNANDPQRRNPTDTKEECRSHVDYANTPKEKWYPATHITGDPTLNSLSEKTARSVLEAFDAAQKRRSERIKTSFEEKMAKLELRQLDIERRSKLPISDQESESPPFSFKTAYSDPDKAKEKSDGESVGEANDEAQDEPKVETRRASAATSDSQGDQYRHSGRMDGSRDQEEDILLPNYENADGTVRSTVSERITYTYESKEHPIDPKEYVSRSDAENSEY